MCQLLTKLGSGARSVLVLGSAVLFAWLPLASQAKTELGGLTFIQAKAEALPLDPTAFARGGDTASGLAASLGSYGYLSSVGGIAFGAIASGASGIKILDLQYEPQSADGRRLLVRLDRRGVSRSFPAPLYDWQLVPIARFAATDQTACFTMFGKLADPQEQEQRRARGEHVLGYHAALKDTLLGWRLLQGDILIIRPDACELPKTDGCYLLGNGEQRWLMGGQQPNVAAHQAAYLKLQDSLRNEPRMFTSYVICDYSQEVRVSVDGKTRTVTLTGDPYWYCWRRKIDEPAAFQELQTRANDRTNAALQNEHQQDSRQLAQDDFHRKWTQEYQQSRFAELFDQIVSASLVQPLPELSRKISTAVRDVNGINPVVYESLVTTMRYAALFRAVRKENPEGYARFIESLSGVQPSPAVETPTVMIDPAKPSQIVVPFR